MSAGHRFVPSCTKHQNRLIWFFQQHGFGLVCFFFLVQCGLVWYGTCTYVGLFWFASWSDMVPAPRLGWFGLVWFALAWFKHLEWFGVERQLRLDGVLFGFHTLSFGWLFTFRPPNPRPFCVWSPVQGTIRKYTISYKTCTTSISLHVNNPSTFARLWASSSSSRSSGSLPPSTWTSGIKNPPPEHQG